MIGRALIALSFGIAAAGNAAAAIFELAPAKDNTIFEDLAGTSNGAGEYFFAGNNAGSEARRALLQFDLSGIPLGSIVTGVSLTLVVSQQARGSDNPTSLHRMLADWGEGTSSSVDGSGTSATAGDATWTYRFFNDPAQVWASPGGDFAPTPSRTIPVSGGEASYTWPTSAQLVADVQGWIDQPATNFGWILIGDESAGQTAKRLFSSENLLTANRPRLTLEVTPIPEPSAYAMLLAGLVVLGVVAGRRRR